MRKRSAPRSAGKVGPNIVRAWFDTVINPLLEWLEHEQQLLSTENWTWRSRPGALEAIRQVRAYAEYDARANLEQFEQLYPQIQSATRSHDKNVSALNEKCRHFYQALRTSEELQSLFRRVTSPESLSEISRNLSDPFGAGQESDHIDLLAEYVVNSVGELDSYYTTAPLWNRYRDEFLAIRDSPTVKHHWEATRKAGHAVSGASQHLSRLLKELRLKLSLEHDVPYVARGESSSRQ